MAAPTRSSSSAFGELVRLELPQMDRPLSSSEDTEPEPEPVLFVRRLFIGWPSSAAPALFAEVEEEEVPGELAFDGFTLEGGSSCGNFDGELAL